jgi:hypothetical protein
MDKNERVKAVLIGVATFVGVLLVISLLRSLIKSETTFADAIKTPYVWFVSALACSGAITAYLKRGDKK